MKRISLYQSAIILSVCLSAFAMAEEKRPAAFGGSDTVTTPAATTAPTTAAPAPAPAKVAQVNEPNAGKFPYVGEVSGVQLNVRSGPGTDYYSCSKISSPMRVVIVGEKNSWAQILPPPGSFSWIFKQYVQADANNPRLGVVTGDSVKVYAGADDRDALVSNSVQVMLNKGQKVTILGQGSGDYYKISPPEGATLWTSSQYMKFVRKADEIDIKIPKNAGSELENATTKEKTNYAKPGVLMDQVDANSKQLEEYYDLAKQLDEEKVKPMEQQDYTKIRAGLQGLVDDKASGKAGQYAEYTLKIVSRCELAKKANDELTGQKTAMQKELDAIEKERQKQRSTIKSNGKFAVTGIFKQSLVYQGQPDIKRFLVVDEKNTPICYAQAVGSAADTNLDHFLGQKVGLVGEVTADSQSFSLIKFTQIELITTPPPKESGETPDGNTPNTAKANTEKEKAEK